MREIMVSSTGRQVEYTFTDKGVVRNDGQSYTVYPDYFQRGSKLYYRPENPLFAGLKPKDELLANADIRCIGVAPDHIEYYVTGNVQQIVDYLKKARELGHKVDYPNKTVLPSVSVYNEPMISFTYSQKGDLLEVCVYFMVHHV